MIKVMTWFKKHRIVVQTYLDEKLSPCRPFTAWCMLMMIVHHFAQEASLVFMRLQGMMTLMCQQVVELSNLSQTFCRLVGGKVPLLRSELQAMAEATADYSGNVATGEFATPLSNVEQFVRSLGTFMSAKFDKNSAEKGAQLHVLRLVSLAFLSTALQLMSITIERNNANKQAFANDQLSPLMLHELVKYMQLQFCVTVSKHILQLQAAKFIPQLIQDIQEEHGELIRCYHAEEYLKIAIDAYDHKILFRDGWGRLGSRFLTLFEFAEAWLRSGPANISLISVLVSNATTTHA
ncbi:hypothetical protein AXG93_3556s1090 [Marchantia polymorpha subsp. ruderalis]|uniref:Uncharacterized protein n=1 Tax=Marchantia polymorpha subsp. ruderalis TaxID=1480154 RepID=A0A176WI55_MARPO|nr:hypothetical protein AXG93_3556s1090 [Marchantia polymorpha subsp. ruderalis]